MPKTSKPSKLSKNALEAIQLWDAYCAMELRRSDPLGIYTGPIDPGVNYFVLMLEQLGATTEFSCEGHFDYGSVGNFYITFAGSMDLALSIRYCGFFSVELEGPDRWSIRRAFKDQTDKEICLRLAAAQWEHLLGPLQIKPPKKRLHSK